MKFAKIALLAALAGVMVLSSCKKKDKDAVLKSFSFDNSVSTTIELTWTARDGSTDHSNGNAYVDLDCYVSDTVLTSGYRTPQYYGASGSSFESFTVPTTAPSKKYYVGVMYYGNEVSPASSSGYVINYTIKAYPTGNVGAAQTYTGTISNASPNSSKVFFEMSLTKSSSGFAFQELSPKFSLTGY